MDHPILLAACGLSALVSVAIAWRYRAAVRRLRWIPSPGDSPPVRGKVSVIVPARNEELELEASVRSILGQKEVDLEVIVIDDGSTDRTGEIADALAASDRRVRVLHDPPLPPGWMGKANAMQQAAAKAGGDFLLLTDADIIHRPGSILAALAEMDRQRADLLSFCPRMRCESLWENAILPVYAALMARFAGSGVEDPASPDAIAVGAFILVRTEAFRAVGGYEQVRGEMFDDVSLARLFKRSGKRVWFRLAPDLLEVRVFKGNRDAFWSPTKNVLAALDGRTWLAVPAMALPFLVFGAPIAAVIAGISGGKAGLAALGASILTLQYGTFFLGRRCFRFRPLKALAFPLVAISSACCFARALYFYAVHGSVFWRGRLVKVREEVDSRQSTVDRG